MTKTFYPKINLSFAFILLLLLYAVSFSTSAAEASEIKLNPSILADIVVSGTVRAPGNNGAGAENMAGVTVLQKNTNNGTATDVNGNFQLTVPDNAVLIFSMIGYKTQEVPVGGRTSLTVNLTLDENFLKEVIVTGYQEVDKKLFTGAATTLSGSDAKREGITDVSRMLEGRVAGVSVQNVSGTFGAAPKIRVRGATSITGDNKPLWVVDGIILEDVVNISNEQLSTGDPSTLLGSSVAGLNPDDIESFQILKDASATSLYGARAMNGVILITTKKGKVGQPTISYTGNFSSYLKPSYRNFDILNSYDQMSVYANMERTGWLNYGDVVNRANGGVYLKMYNQLDYANGSETPGLYNSPEARAEFLNKYARANTDWFDVLFRNSFQQEHSLSLSSGTEKTQMYYSTSYLQDNGWSLGNGVQRFTGNVRANFNISDKVQIGLITQGSIRDQQAPGSLGRNSNPVTGEFSRDFDINPFSYALNTSRVLTPYDENGNREFFRMNFAPFNILHELETNTLDLNLVDLKVQGEFRYNILRNLKYAFDGAYRYAKTGQEHKIHENSNMPQAYRAADNATIRAANRFLYTSPEDPDAEAVSVLPAGGFYITNDDFLKSYYLRNSLDYNLNFNEVHTLRLFGSQELRYIDRTNKQFTGYGYQYDKGGIPFIDPNAIKQAVEGNFNYYSMNMGFDRYLAFASNAAYSYASKYQLNGTVRYDGSNLLGEARSARWLPTWNISSSWNADEEGFMKNIPVISQLTVRATYGLTASMGNATNSSLVLQSGSTLRPYLTEVESGIGIQYLENSELTWEKQYETNVGLNIGLFQNKLTATVDAYNRDGFDLIGPIRTSGIGGEAVKIANYADMESRGIEGTLGASIIQEKNYGWRTQLTFGYNKGTITNLKSEPMIWDLVGANGGPKQGYSYRGLFSIDFDKLNTETGSPIFIDEDGEAGNNVYLQSNVTDYLKYEGPVDPTINGGFYNAFNFKNFTASALLTYSAGNKIRLNPVYKNTYTDLDAMTHDFLTRFLFPSDDGTPSIIESRNESSLNGAYPYNAYNYSSERVANGEFVRLKQVSVGYNLPTILVSRFHLKNMSLNLVANNLWLIYADKKLNGQDPEFFSTGGVALPVPRQFTLSLKVGI